jgi:type IV secretory pathway TrbF-like protein
MKLKTMIKHLIPSAGWFGAAASWAHEGHGLPGASHWHASDVLGFVVALAVIGAMIWLNGRDR